MATQTPRLNLDKYSQGDDNWSHSDTVDTVDELSIDRDTVANRPASGTYDDEFFFATDDDVIYSWNTTSSSWEERLYGKGSTPTWTGEHTFSSGIDATGGFVELSGSGMQISGDTQASSGSGIEAYWNSGTTPSQGELFAYDRDNSAFRDLRVRADTIDLQATGGTVDLSGQNANLRIAEGQSIEDDGNNSRIRILQNATTVDYPDDTSAYQARDNAVRILPQSGKPLDVFDQEMSGSAIKYTTDASTGTLSLTNANLDVNGNDITNAGSLSADDLQSPATGRIHNEFQLEDQIAEIPIPDISRNRQTVVIQLDGLRSTSDQVPIYIQFRADGGSYQTTTEYEYVLDQLGADSTDRSETNTGVSEIKLGEVYRNTFAQRGNHAEIRFGSPYDGGGWPQIHWTASNVRTGGELQRIRGVGALDSNVAVDQIRLFELDSGSPSQISTARGRVISYPGVSP